MPVALPDQAQLGRVRGGHQIVRRQVGAGGVRGGRRYRGRQRGRGGAAPGVRPPGGRLHLPRVVPPWKGAVRRPAGAARRSRRPRERLRGGMRRRGRLLPRARRERTADGGTDDLRLEGERRGRGRRRGGAKGDGEGLSRGQRRAAPRGGRRQDLLRPEPALHPAAGRRLGGRRRRRVVSRIRPVVGAGRWDYRGDFGRRELAVRPLFSFSDEM
mmetsp:Transcript_12748/g.27539  ORF Transcript_12748/g.27539 Transcript_12748/m.27539 type:complete len:214 (+) Transcript_12748:669-1310(+)